MAPRADQILPTAGPRLTKMIKAAALTSSVIISMKTCVRPVEKSRSIRARSGALLDQLVRLLDPKKMIDSCVPDVKQRRNAERDD